MFVICQKEQGPVRINKNVFKNEVILDVLKNNSYFYPQRKFIE